MSNDVFGDIELDDVWDADPTIEALQVAIRVHELRSALNALAGATVRRWQDLARRDQDYLLIVGQSIADRVDQREPDDPAVIARLVHEDSSLTNWDDLPPDHQQIAVDLLTLIVAWLEAEGPR